MSIVQYVKHREHHVAICIWPTNGAERDGENV